MASATTKTRSGLWILWRVKPIDLGFLLDTFSDSTGSDLSSLKGSPNKGRYSVDFKVFSLLDYPNGDNRMFTIHGSHTFGDVMDRIKDKYSYMGQVIPVYKTHAGEAVTIDSDESYDKILYEVFSDKLARQAEMKLYIRPASERMSSSIFGRLEQKGRPS